MNYKTSIANQPKGIREIPIRLYIKIDVYKPSFKFMATAKSGAKSRFYDCVICIMYILIYNKVKTDKPQPLLTTLASHSSYSSHEATITAERLPLEQPNNE